MPETSRVEQLADLNTVGGGAAAERFATELRAVLENIRDVNTSWKGKRKIKMEWTFEPDEERQVCKVTLTAQHSVPGTKPVSEVLYVARHEGELVGTVVHGAPGDARQGHLAIEKRSTISG